MKMIERAAQLRIEAANKIKEAEELEKRNQDYKSHMEKSKTFKSLKEDFNGRENELVLDYFTVARFIKIDYDENDFYYVLDFGGNRGIVWSSCVGWIFKLKGVVSDTTYEQLQYVWNLNNEIKAI